MVGSRLSIAATIAMGCTIIAYVLVATVSSQRSNRYMLVSDGRTVLATSDADTERMQQFSKVEKIIHEVEKQKARLDSAVSSGSFEGLPDQSADDSGANDSANDISADTQSAEKAPNTSKLPEGVNWGIFDCALRGPAWESRALGCTRPGGCGLKPREPRTNTFVSCGKSSEFCINAFKSCLAQVGAGDGQKPTRKVCECMEATSWKSADRCKQSCIADIAGDYSTLTKTCFGLNVKQQCALISLSR